MNVAVAQREAPGELDAALAAVRGDGLTLIAIRAPVIAPSAIVEAWPDAPVVAWASNELSLVGIDVAIELRGHGVDRWTQVVAAARRIEIPSAIIVDPASTAATARDAFVSMVREVSTARGARGATTRHASGSSARDDGSIRELGVVPRFVGGAAFVPGAADAGPWAGFGDAWFVLPRWTYMHDGSDAWLLLVVDAAAASDTRRWHTDLATFRRAFAGAARSAATSDDARARDVSTVAHATRTSDSGETPARGRAAMTADGVALWRAQVDAVTSAIANGACSKVVAARTCSVALDHVECSTAGADTATGRGTVSRSSANAAGVLAALEARHPECFRVLVRPPGGGTLVAATPERLVKLDANGIRCDALAGTVRLDTPDAEARLLASDKDRREHALVVDAIRDALDHVGAVVDAPDRPTIKRLRHVLHLHTPIRATAPRGDHPASLHLLELAARLHPTPAVGGTPTAFAVDWIREHEPAPRGWYASPVGWFDLDGNGELAVAIRSGVIVGGRAHLWAGAGIVAGSDPDRELAETELKLRAMLGALRGGEP